MDRSPHFDREKVVAHIVFFARSKNIASHQLEDSIVIGRSLDCDIFIPDIFVSRLHCLIEPSAGGWMIVDLDCKNGIFFRGARIKRRMLHDGDILELGSIAIQFDVKDMLCAETSSKMPYGKGVKLAELMDTLYAAELRPAEFVSRNVRRAPQVLDLSAEPEVVTTPPEDEGWEDTELDIEFQIVADAESDLEKLRPPAERGLAAVHGVANPDRYGATATRTEDSVRSVARSANGPRQGAHLLTAMGELQSDERRRTAQKEETSEVPTLAQRLLELGASFRLEEFLSTARSKPILSGTLAASVGILALGLTIYFSAGRHYAPPRIPPAPPSAKNPYDN